MSDCYIPIIHYDDREQFVLTTESSDGLSGSRFNQGGGIEAELVSSIKLEFPVGDCNGTTQITINNHYGLPSTGSIRLFDVLIDPDDLVGDDC